MYFLDPTKKKFHTVRLFTGYFLVATAIALASATLVYFAYGFNVIPGKDSAQKGLLFVSSQPSGAQLTINGKSASNTSTKLNLGSGKYDLSIAREGYTNWSRSVQIEGSSVNHFLYPLLLPSKLEPKTVKTFNETPSLTTQSPDRRWLVAHYQAINESQFEMFDLNNNQDSVGQSQAFTLPADMLSETTQAAQWKLVEWSSNNRHMLFLRTFTSASNGETKEYILVDRQRPEGSYNLSKNLQIDANVEVVSLSDKKPDSYYVHNATTGDLTTMKLDSSEKQKLLSDVVAFKSHGKDMVVYITSRGAEEGKVVAKIHANDKDYTLRQITQSDVYMLDAARYSGSWYVVVGSKAESRALVYEDPISQITGSKEKKAGALFALKVANPTQVSFSANAQYIALQGASKVHVYDIDREFAYQYGLQNKLDAPQEYARWMDGDRLTFVSGGKQNIIDYDNINKRSLVNSSAVYESAFDRDYKYLYTFTQTEAGLELASTPLRTANDL